MATTDGERLIGELALDGDLDMDAARRFGEEARMLVRDCGTMSERPFLRLTINSDGGGYKAGCRIVTDVRRLQASGVLVEAFVAGVAGSMAAVVAAAADRTLISRSGALMWHGLRMTQFNGDAAAMQSRLARLEQQIDVVTDILLERARRLPERRDPRLARRRQLRALMRSDGELWFSPAEALAAGVVDAIGEPSLS